MKKKESIPLVLILIVILLLGSGCNFFGDKNKQKNDKSGAEIFSYPAQVSFTMTFSLSEPKDTIVFINGNKMNFRFDTEFSLDGWPEMLIDFNYEELTIYGTGRKGAGMNQLGSWVENETVDFSKVIQSSIPIEFSGKLTHILSDQKRKFEFSIKMLKHPKNLKKSEAVFSDVIALEIPWIIFDDKDGNKIQFFATWPEDMFLIINSSDLKDEPLTIYYTQTTEDISPFLNADKPMMQEVKKITHMQTMDLKLDTWFAYVLGHQGRLERYLEKTSEHYFSAD